MSLNEVFEQTDSEIIVLKDVLVFNRSVDVTISGGKVVNVGSSGRADITISCNDYIVIPAGLDMHVHMRDGAQKDKEVFATGTKSALAGGVTLVIDQSNTIPPLTTPDLIKKRVNLATGNSYCNFGINAALTPETSITECSKSGAMAIGEVFFGSSSSYLPEVTGDLFQKATLEASKCKIPVFVHAEKVSPGEDADLLAHDSLRSPENEVEAIKFVLDNTRGDNKLYFCHLSSTAELFAAHGYREVTPHHLFLSREMFESDDTFVKVNPPIRSEKERKELLKNFRYADTVGSDHAPHTIKDKSLSFEEAPSGIPGVETMIPILMAKYLKKEISLSDIVDKTSSNQSDILSIRRAGFNLNDRADFAIYPKVTTTISADDLHSRAPFTPYEGMDAVFPEYVIMDGHLVYDRGEFSDPSGMWIRGKGYCVE